MKSIRKIADPFNYWSGEKTLAAGAVGWIVMAAINRLGGQTTRGVVSSGYADLTFLQALCQILAAWLVLATLLYIAARLLSNPASGRSTSTATSCSHASPCSRSCSSGLCRRCGMPRCN